MVSGTFVLTDTIDKAFSTIFEESYAGTDAVVSSKAADISFQGDSADVEPVPESLLATVRGVETVDAAAGSVVDESATKIIDGSGKAIDTNGAPSFGFGLDANPALARFNPLNILEGRWPRGPGEVVVDAGTVDEQHFELGDTVKIATLEPVQSFRLVGIARYGTVDSLGSATFAVFDIPTAQKLLHREGTFDGISVAAKDGVTPEQLVVDLRRALPPTAQARTGAEEASEASEDISQFTTIIRYFLLAFGAIALFVGAFVIFNTLSITVAQRTREFATLRTIGASRRQVKRSVVLEGLVIGLLASVIGLVAGLGIAKGMVALISALGLDLPEAGTVVQTRTIVVAMILGTGITVLASILPARRATRVPPIAAVREGSVLPPSRFAAHSAKTGYGVVLASLAAISAGIFAGGVSAIVVALLFAGGVLGLFMGIALLAPSLVKPLARIVGWPARRAGGIAGDLAGANAVRNPGRTASTAAALMIGLTLVTLVAVLGSGITVGNKAAITDQLHAGYIVDGNDDLPFRAAEGDKLAATPGVKSASHVRADTAIVQGK